MENPQSTNLSENNVSTIPKNTPISTARNINILLPVVLTLFISSVVFGFGGYFLGKENSVSELESTSQNDKISEPTSIPTPSTSAPNSIDSGSNLISSPECGVKFSLPKRASEGDLPYWQAPRGGAYPNLLALINPQLIGQDSHSQFAAMYTTDDAASGYIDAAVVVSCVNFRMNITMNYEILNALIAGVSEYNKTPGEKGMRPESYTLRHMPINKWGRDVLQITLNDEEYYTFIGKDGVYEVRAFGATKDPEILKQRQKHI